MIAEVDIQRILLVQRDIESLKYAGGSEHNRKFLEILFPFLWNYCPAEEKFFELSPYAKHKFESKRGAVLQCYRAVIDGFISWLSPKSASAGLIDEDDFENMLNSLLQINAFHFHDLCKYKNKLEEQWNSFRDEKCFSSEPVDSSEDYDQNGPIDIPEGSKPKKHSMDNILECQRKLKNANKAIGFMGKSCTEFKRYPIYLNFQVLDDHRLYLNLGKIYKGNK